MDDDPAAAVPDEAGEASLSGESDDWERQPVDLVRLVLAVSIGTVAIVVSLVRPERVRGVSVDIVNLLNGLPRLLTDGIVGVLQVGALVIPLIGVAFLVRRRWREVLLASVGAVIAAVASVVITRLLGDAVPRVVLAESERPSWITGAAFPSNTYLAAMAAALTVLAASVTRSWRRYAWATLVVAAIARVVTAVAVPLNVAATVCIGIAVGSTALAMAGSPSRRIRPGELRLALARFHISAGAIRRRRRGGTGRAVYDVSSDRGELEVSVIGRDDRNADLLARAARAAFVAGIDEPWTTSPRRTTEREALVHYLARSSGTHVAEPVAIGEADRGAWFLARRPVHGRPLAEFGDELGDDVARAVFAQLAALHDAGVAHTQPSTETMAVAAGGEVWFTDLRFAAPAADERLLATDIACLLVAVALQIGAERAVGAAASATPPARLQAALAFVQLPVLMPPALRAAARRSKNVLSGVRKEIEDVTGCAPAESLEVRRITLRKIVTFVGTVVLANVLLRLIANFGDIWDALRRIDPVALPLLIALALAGYPLGAISLKGAVDRPLPFGRTTQVMFAQSFLNRFTPANAGGMALRTRFLQQHGVDLPVAAAGVGLTSVASGVMQVVLSVLFFTWAGTSDAGPSFGVPSIKTIVIIVLAGFVVAGIVVLSAFGKRLLAKAHETVGTVISSFVVLARQPTKLLMLFGAAGIGKLCAILAFAQAAHAFGIAPGLPAIGAMYLTATTVAAAAPTPGGVGAIEAALAAGLVGLGSDAGTAAAAVLTFRVVTYWLPILPCWLALTLLRRAGES